MSTELTKPGPDCTNSPHEQNTHLLPFSTWYDGLGRVLLQLTGDGRLILGDHVTPREVAEELMRQWEHLLDGRAKVEVSGERRRWRVRGRVWGILDGHVYLDGGEVHLSIPIPDPPCDGGGGGVRPCSAADHRRAQARVRELGYPSGSEKWDAFWAGFIAFAQGKAESDCPIPDRTAAERAAGKRAPHRRGAWIEGFRSGGAQ